MLDGWSTLTEGAMARLEELQPLAQQVRRRAAQQEAAYEGQVGLLLQHAILLAWPALH